MVHGGSVYCELFQMCEETCVTFAECSMVTTTLVLELDTKSIAPPFEPSFYLRASCREAIIPSVRSLAFPCCQSHKSVKG